MPPPTRPRSREYRDCSDARVVDLCVRGVLPFVPVGTRRRLSCADVMVTLRTATRYAQHWNFDRGTPR